MPGNDPTAQAEFERTYGASPNAEALLEVHKQRFSKELREASLNAQDDAATAALDLDKVGKAKGVNGEVQSAAVRGAWVVAVYEDADGRLQKVAVERDKVGPTEAQIAKAAEDPGKPRPGHPKRKTKK